MNRLCETRGQRVFNVFNIIFLICLMVVTLYPFLYVVFASVSDASKLMLHEGILWAPEGFQLGSYQKVFENSMITRGYLNTLLVVVVGVSINMIVTSLGAYGLSREGVFWNKPITLLVIFTMFFQGGLVPRYLAIRSMHLDNTYWALLLPGAVNTFYLILMRTGFASVPKSLEEAATLDGAGHVRILFQVIVPLAMPTIAVMILYYAVGHWNAWFDAMIFLRERKMYPLQLVLREILINNDTRAMTSGATVEDEYSVSENVKYAVIVVATVPILCVYPFLQKYFVKGVMIGAVKG